MSQLSSPPEAPSAFHVHKSQAARAVLFGARAVLFGARAVLFGGLLVTAAACSDGSDDDADDDGKGGAESSPGTGAQSGGDESSTGGSTGGSGASQNGSGASQNGSGGTGEIPQYDQCVDFKVGIDPIKCYECCLDAFAGLVSTNTEKSCICESPRPCDDACDSTFCNEDHEGAESSECFQCRLDIADKDLCAVEDTCQGDPQCEAYADCLTKCDD